MKRLALKISLVICLISVAGCTTGPQNLATSYQEETGSGYCHKKLAPVGASDLVRPTQPNGDYIDYYGPCSGPSDSEQLQKQRRFEQYRFGRDYMDEG